VSSTPLLGFITPKERTQDQHDAHAAAMAAACVKFTLPMPQLAKGEALRLTDFHKDPLVTADRGGKVFTRIHQWTGSCVWAGGTNALVATLSAARLSANPVKAILPFTLHNYAMSRHYMGDDSQGDGSMGSTFYKSLTQDSQGCPGGEQVAPYGRYRRVQVRSRCPRLYPQRLRRELRLQ
jgi:hypothetical protein